MKKIIIAASLLASTILPLSNAVAYEDRVLVIVNEDVITQSEFDYRMATVMDELSNSGQTPPPGLAKQLLDTMVSDRLQVQEAERRGITVSDEEVQATLQRFAAQQDVTVDQMRRQVQDTGQPFDMFVESVRDSMVISRFTDYYARSRVIVPEYEIDGFIAANNLDQDTSEYEIARILIKTGDGAAELAQQVRSEIGTGMNFEQAVSAYSQATDAEDGGVIGWRNAAQLPEVYVSALQDMQVGDVSPVLTTANGYHILKLLDLKGDRTEIIQSKVRHILISAESRVAKSQAAKKLRELRKRIVEGEDFSALARIYSDDSVSAANGGSLDWVSPGEMVPPFEEAFQKLSLGEISFPVETQFGMHIIIVDDRRKKNITEQMIRGRADQILRRQRADREYKQWVNELQEGAYVEFVTEPESLGNT
ncbi:peptidylprolyl isomerase [Arenicella chitinivorans]|uniref:peptidylprolyl isomerase n=1 Tax=Arenicella chitinivorans TaxID=1329800 RepID=UPI0016737F23|nr:peptidylprolyl isomerase [Arenicella chitinivorans]